MKACDRCRQPFVSSNAECPSCGYMRPGERGVECELHEGADAVACCFVCGKPMCGDCAAWNGSMFLCDVAAHREIADGWDVIAQCSSVFEADMIAINLRQGGFHHMVFSPGDFTVSFWHPELSTARVFVRKENREKARMLLEALSLEGKP